MNINTDTIATTVAFTPAEGVEVELHASRPSKEEAIKLGWAYTEAASNGHGKVLDETLDAHGPVLVRRSLQAFANYSKRQGWKDVAEYAMALREEIKVVHSAKAA